MQKSNLKKDFWSLEGVLKSKLQLTDRELKDARHTFLNWGKPENTKIDKKLKKKPH